MSLFPSQLLSAADARFSENSRKSFLQLLHNATVVAAASGSDGSFNYKRNFSPSVNWHHQYSPPLWYFNSKGDFHTQYPWSIKSTNSPPKRNKLNINRSETLFSYQFVYFQDLDSYFVWNWSKLLRNIEIFAGNEMRANIQSRSPAAASPGRLCMKPEIRGISGEFGDSAKLLELLRQLTYGPPGLRFYTNGVFRKEHTIIGNRQQKCFTHVRFLKF